MSTYVKYVQAYYDLAEKCLTRYWGKKNVGWDNGSPAHRCAVEWVKKNYKQLKAMTWKKVYQEYLLTLRQD